MSDTAQQFNQEAPPATLADRVDALLRIADQGAEALNKARIARSMKIMELTPDIPLISGVLQTVTETVQKTYEQVAQTVNDVLNLDDNTIKAASAGEREVLRTTLANLHQHIQQQRAACAYPMISLRNDIFEHQQMMVAISEEMTVFVQAVPELLRRYDEIYIPQAQKSGTPEEAINLQYIRDDLEKEAAREKRMIETMQQQNPVSKMLLPLQGLATRAETGFQALVEAVRHVEKKLEIDRLCHEGLDHDFQAPRAVQVIKSSLPQAINPPFKTRRFYCNLLQ